MLKQTNFCSRFQVWLFTIVAVSLTVGCLNKLELNIDKVGFADRIRTDRQTLTEEQKNRDMDFGTYATADGDLVAEIYPFTMHNGIADNLPLSDCLWLGRHKEEFRGGDSIQLTWETIFTLLDNNNNAYFQGDNIFGACRFDNAADRQSGDFETGDPSEQWHLDLGNISFPFSIDGPEDGFDGPRPPDWPGINRDLVEFYYPLLVEHNNRTDNPYGECPANNAHFHDEPAPVVDKPDRDFNCLHTETGRVPACGKCRITPLEDASYLLTSNNSFTFSRWMKPNIMVVRGERRMTREMTVSHNDDQTHERHYVWSTPVTSNQGLTRWHENFSSSVIVSKVRLFERTRNGTERTIDNIETVELRANYHSTAIDPFPVRYICSGETVAGEGTVFDFGQTETCVYTRTGVAESPNLTPTYDTKLLAAERTDDPDSVLKAPLIWQAQFTFTPDENRPGEDPKPRNPVYIEFTLNYKNTRAALRMDKAVVDLGQVQTGQRNQEYAHGLIINSGGHPMRINKVAIESYPAQNVPSTFNAPPGTFTYRLPYEPKMIPLPIDVPTADDKTPSDGEKGVRSTVTLGRDAKAFELLNMEISKDCKDEKITRVDSAIWANLLNRRDLSASEAFADKTLKLYGEPVKMDGQWAFYENPNADFEKKAKAHYADGFERLIAQTGLNVRIPPFDLLPGESADVLISARPQVTGELFAALKVESFSLWDPDRYVRPVITVLAVKGLQGPDLNFMPSILNFPRRSGGVEHWDSIITIQNAGDLDMTRSDIRITGADASRFEVITAHSATNVLQPRQFEDFRVRYTPRICGDRNDPVPPNVWHEAELRISTDGGEAIVLLKANGEACTSNPNRQSPFPGYKPPPPRMRTQPQ